MAMPKKVSIPAQQPVSQPASQPAPLAPVLTTPAPVKGGFPMRKSFPPKPTPQMFLEPENIEVEAHAEIEDYLIDDSKFSRAERRRMNRAGKTKPSDDSLIQRIEAELLVALAKIYPENKDIIAERDKRVQPKMQKKIEKSAKGKKLERKTKKTHVSR